MKKLTTFIYVFAGIILGAIIYLDVKYQWGSFNWLLTKLAGTIIIIIAMVFVVIKGEESIGNKIFRICTVFFWMGYMMGYKSIVKYNTDVQQNKFGPAFNVERRKLGVPEIPAGWFVEFKGNRFIEWQAKDTTIGHQSKYVSIEDTAWDVKLEIDDYKLKTAGSVSRNLSIRTQFARGNVRDSVFYYFNPGDSSHLISRQVADSIFTAENIKRDYR